VRRVSIVRLLPALPALVLLVVFLLLACGDDATAVADSGGVEILWQEDAGEFEVTAFCINESLFLTFAGEGPPGLGAVQVMQDDATWSEDC
jgi:hypothetical protein